jgi:uncharacterized protein YciI
MYFAIIGLDRPGTADLRLRTRPAHREYLQADRRRTISRPQNHFLLAIPTAPQTCSRR